MNHMLTLYYDIVDSGIKFVDDDIVTKIMFDRVIY